MDDIDSIAPLLRGEERAEVLRVGVSRGAVRGLAEWPFRDSIEPGRTGWLAGDEAEWTKAILGLVDDDVLRARVGRAAYLSVLWRYGAEARIECMRSLLAHWEAAGAQISCPYFKSVLAEGMAQLGDLDGALDLIEEITTQIERPGWEELSHYAETLRVKGCLLSLKGEPEGAERSYLASLD